ncbi:ATP-grasp fold amidoligase family protein [Oceanobacillus alkalisoli]|uniref:ATP-grasp fold amidoligase family protein n=1 Tax=Oceanobacillus alkalisoli TaxID=2925113 RepID=UPI001EE41371|nr:ATP-grasp fold amidoligase family protein [Oceanobacillus alkalisoli]MCG5102603.1 glycosyl transferase [Oceanobacillus alkalisoli]
MSKLNKNIFKLSKWAIFFGSRGLLNFLPDKAYIKLVYYLKMKKKLDLNDTKEYNEKLQWLKLYDRKPYYEKIVDKYEVREIIKNKIGEDYLTPIYGIWENFDDIDFSELPSKFVIKCTHDSGGVVICEDKNSFNIQRARKKINKSMNRNYFWRGREWPYKNLKPRIICEQFIEQDDGEELRDYRFFCFNGEPKFISVDFSITDKSRTRRNLYDLDWNLMDEEMSYPKELNINVNKPNKLEEMIELSKILSSDIPHVRVDFYYVGGKIRFGEMTLFHQSGLGEIRPAKFNKKMGSWLKLPD